ncbi:aldo/keto reductase, partial [Nostoc sp. MG11]|uniref:aldo/keto reductase n=1 Tax=Nostoc sp. MG11 TaxID=2721166 RepID=UPI001D024D89
SGLRFFTFSYVIDVKNALTYLSHPHGTFARGLLFENFGQRYLKPNVSKAVAAYVEIAKRHQLSPAQLAIAFVRSCWFVASTIIGATTLEQLKENIESINVVLDKDILAELDAVHTQYPNPAP